MLHGEDKIAQENQPVLADSQKLHQNINPKRRELDVGASYVHRIRSQPAHFDQLAWIAFRRVEHLAPKLFDVQIADIEATDGEVE
jgi:hypothetical protein